MVHLAGERRLAYPALTYFHSARERVSSLTSLVTLDEALFLLCLGVDSPAPDRACVETVRRAVRTFLDTGRSGVHRP